MLIISLIWLLLCILDVDSIVDMVTIVSFKIIDWLLKIWNISRLFLTLKLQTSMGFLLVEIYLKMLENKDTSCCHKLVWGPGFLHLDSPMHILVNFMSNFRYNINKRCFTCNKFKFGHLKVPQVVCLLFLFKGNITRTTNQKNGSLLSENMDLLSSSSNF